MLKLLYAELHHYQTVLQQAFGHGGQLSYRMLLNTCVFVRCVLDNCMFM